MECLKWFKYSNFIAFFPDRNSTATGCTEEEDLVK
jgi:hypothetical protein